MKNVSTNTDAKIKTESSDHPEKRGEEEKRREDREFVASVFVFG